jgi:hypothetical protein
MSTVINQAEELLWIDEEYEFLREAREWISVPEKRLLFAILERAARDCLGAQLEDIEQSSTWLFIDEDDYSTPFSFAWVCENLGVDPDEFRGRILRAAAPRKLRELERLMSNPMRRSQTIASMPLAEAA